MDMAVNKRFLEEATLFYEDVGKIIAWLRQSPYLIGMSILETDEAGIWEFYDSDDFMILYRTSMEDKTCFHWILSLYDRDGERVKQDVITEIGEIWKAMGKHNRYKIELN